MPTVLIQIDAGICINACLKVISGPEQRNVLVVLRHHQFLELLLLPQHHLLSRFWLGLLLVHL